MMPPLNNGMPAKSNAFNKRSSSIKGEYESNTGPSTAGMNV